MKRWGIKRSGGLLKKALMAGIVLTGLILIGSILKSNLFLINNVSVKLSKVTCTSEDPIKQTSQLLGQHYLFIDTSKIEQNLKQKHPCIKEINLVRIPPNRIILEVKGREAVVQLLVSKSPIATSSAQLDLEATPSSQLKEADQFLVDEEGVIFGRNGRQDLAKIITDQRLTLGQTINPDSLKILNQVEVFGLEIKEAKIYPDGVFLVYSTAKIIFNFEDNIDTQLASLQLILKKAKIDEEKIEFIDLRFDKPIVKFAPKKNG